MAFWKLKFFKNGSATRHSNEYKDEAEQSYDFKNHMMSKSKGDSPRNSSISSLEEAYSNYPSVEKMDPSKRQMVPGKEPKCNGTVSDGRWCQSLTMDEVEMQQQLKMELSLRNGNKEEKMRSANSSPRENEFSKPEVLRSSPPPYLNYGPSEMKMPSQIKRNDENKPSPPLKISPKTSGEYIRYSPTWNNEQQKQPSPDKYKSNVPHNQRINDKEKKVYISTVSVPQQTAPCFVVNNPCPYTGTYPCYVMNVCQSTPYVPVQIYPMMLVPNPPSNHTQKYTNRIVY